MSIILEAILYSIHSVRGCGGRTLCVSQGAKHIVHCPYPATSQSRQTLCVFTQLRKHPVMRKPPFRHDMQPQAEKVIVEVQLNEQGEVVDATVLSGPVELRRAALQAVLP